MLSICNNRSTFYQWDLDQRLQVLCNDCTAVHFNINDSQDCPVCEIIEEDGKRYVLVPNILLQSAGVLRAFLMAGEKTLCAVAFRIIERPKPDGYVYTETEVQTWAQLGAMIGNLDNLETEARENLVAAVNELVGKSGSADPDAIVKIVADYLAANPPKENDPTVSDWAKQPEKPEYTAEEVGALSQNSLQTGIDQALAQAKESGLFDGPQGPQGEQGPQGPQGIPGGDYVLTDADKADIAELAAALVDVPDSVTDEHINELINTALSAIPNAAEVAY